MLRPVVRTAIRVDRGYRLLGVRSESPAKPPRWCVGNLIDFDRSDRFGKFKPHAKGGRADRDRPMYLLRPRDQCAESVHLLSCRDRRSLVDHDREHAGRNFVDNVDRLNFDNWTEHEALYPEGRPIAELLCPFAKSHRQVPVSTRVTLGARGPGHWCYRQLSCRWSKKAAFDGRLRFWVASTPRTQRP